MLTKYHCALKWHIEDFDDQSRWVEIEAQTPAKAAEAFAEQYWFENPNKACTWMGGHWAVGVKPVERTTWVFFDVTIKVKPVFRATENRLYVLRLPTPTT